MENVKTQESVKVNKATFPTYEERISASAEDKTQLERQYQVEDTKEQLLADIKVTTRASVEADRDLLDLYSGFPIDSTAILAKEDEVEALNAGVKRLKALVKKLFR